jgi:hypothetical protein
MDFNQRKQAISASRWCKPTYDRITEDFFSMQHHHHRHPA